MDPMQTGDQSANQPLGVSASLQPLEVATGVLSPLVPSIPPSGASGKSTSNRRWPTWLAFLGCVMSALCLGGLIYTYRVYDAATKPNRTTPAVATQNYLQLTLVDRDDARAARYACRNHASLASFLMYRDQAISYAAAKGDNVAFSWEIGKIATTGSVGSVAVTITQVTSAESGESGRSLHPWTFTVQMGSGWSVCAANAQ